jgi:hypothetical protein
MSIANENQYRKMAALIPPSIRKTILDEKFIDTAFYTSEDINSAMGYLFDVYEEFLDPTHEHGNFYCKKCKEAILSNLRAIKPYLEQLNK